MKGELVYWTDSSGTLPGTYFGEIIGYLPDNVTVVEEISDPPEDDGFTEITLDRLDEILLEEYPAKENSYPVVKAYRYAYVEDCYEKEVIPPYRLSKLEGAVKKKVSVRDLH